MINNKIWITSISITISIEIIIFFDFGVEKEHFYFYLLPLLFLIPIMIADKNLKGIEGSRENDVQVLTNQIKDLEGVLADYQYIEKEYRSILDQNQGYLFSLNTLNQKWFLSNESRTRPEMTTEEFDHSMKMIEADIYDEDRDKYLKKKQQWLSGVPVNFEFRTVLGEDQIYWKEMRVTSQNDFEEGKKITGMIIDITDRKEKEEKLLQMAYYDNLTDLPNRSMLKSHLKKALSRAKRKEHEVAIMFIDLDGFKSVNDTLGHEAGDSLLQQVAERLTASVREEDLISRLGGDEFIVVFEETNKEEISGIAERVMEDISSPFLIDDNTVTVTPSIGIAIYPENGFDIEALVRNADKAMYAVKAKGKGNYQFYSPDLEDTVPKKSLIDKVLSLFQK